jgi:hypothetical protein
MRTSQAIFEAADKIQEILVAAGVKDGIKLGQEELKTSKDPLFWLINTPSQIASDKQTYVIYTVTTTPKIVSGDGKVISRQVSVTIDINSRLRINRDLITKIDEEFEKEGIILELNSPLTYNQATQLYNYSFVTYVLASDGPEAEPAE